MSDLSVFTFKTSIVWDPEYLCEYLKLRQKVAGHCSAPLELLSATGAVPSTTASPPPLCWNQNFISFMLLRLQPP